MPPTTRNGRRPCTRDPALNEPESSDPRVRLNCKQCDRDPHMTYLNQRELTAMTYQRTEDLPSDVERVYRDLAITKQEERERLQLLGEGEECFKWQVEPTGPVVIRPDTRFVRWDPRTRPELNGWVDHSQLHGIRCPSYG